jgi:hypothetical protein
VPATIAATAAPGVVVEARPGEMQPLHALPLPASSLLLLCAPLMLLAHAPR